MPSTENVRYSNEPMVCMIASAIRWGKSSGSISLNPVRLFFYYIFFKLVMFHLNPNLLNYNVNSVFSISDELLCVERCFWEWSCICLQAQIQNIALTDEFVGCERGRRAEWSEMVCLVQIVLSRVEWSLVQIFPCASHLSWPFMTFAIRWHYHQSRRLSSGEELPAEKLQIKHGIWFGA